MPSLSPLITSCRHGAIDLKLRLFFLGCWVLMLLFKLLLYHLELL